MTSTPTQLVGGALPLTGSSAEVCEDRGTGAILAVNYMEEVWIPDREPAFAAPELAFSVPSIEVSVRIAPQGERIRGPEVKLARRRFQRGSVRCRKNRWELRWREDVELADGRVKREQRTTFLGTTKELPTKRMAQREADMFLARVNRADYRPVKRATFLEFSEHWKNQVSGLLKLSTAKVMRSHLAYHLLPVFGRMRLDEIGQEQVQVFVTRLSKGRSRHTILNVLGTLASILKMARRWGYAVAGFTQADLVIPCSAPPKPARFFTAEQVRAIVALAAEPWRTMWAIQAMTGIRPGEVLGLSIDDLDFEQRLIFIRRSAWYRHLISPKSNRSVATVPMPEPLAAVLTNYLAAWRPNEKRLLFANRRGNPYSENKVVQHRLWPILDALAIPRCGMHAFRHSHGSLLHSSGASLKVAQTQLRHADATTTSRYYLHVVGSEQRDAAERVAQQLWPNVAQLWPNVAKTEGKSRHVN